MANPRFGSQRRHSSSEWRTSDSAAPFVMHALHGKHILVVEDEWLLADEICSAIQSEGGSILGPYASRAEALDALASAPGAPDAATLNVQLVDGESYPVADQLKALGIPFLFASANGRSTLPDRFSRNVLLSKPLGGHRVAQALAVLVEAD
jgi:CheY-like chemotaxis protein